MKASGPTDPPRRPVGRRLTAVAVVVGVAVLAVFTVTRITAPDGQSDVAELTRSSPTSRPGPTSTGVPVGTTLTPASGNLRVSTPNTVLDSLDLAGTITVDAPGVVVTRSRLRGGPENPYGIRVVSGSVTITDTELSGYANAIAGDGWAAYRVDIYGTTEDGVKLGSDVTLADSWIHDLAPAEGSHADGAQMQSGVRNLVVRNNVIDVSGVDSSGNAAIFLAPDLGPSTSGPVTIADNYLDGGNYVLYSVDGDDGRYVVDNITISGNRFGRNFRYGPSRVTVEITQAGNVWDDDGSPLAL